MKIPNSIIVITGTRSECNVKYEPAYWAKAYQRLWPRGTTIDVSPIPISPEEIQAKIAYDEAKAKFDAGELTGDNKRTPEEVIRDLRSAYEGIAEIRYHVVGSISEEVRTLQNRFPQVFADCWRDPDDVAQDMSAAIARGAEAEKIADIEMRSEAPLPDASYVEAGIPGPVAVKLQAAGYPTVASAVGLTLLQVSEITGETPVDAQMVVNLIAKA